MRLDRRKERSLPNQQRTLSKLPITVVRCRNFIIKHRLSSVQICAKRAKMSVRWTIFRLSFHFSYQRWWLGGRCKLWRSTDSLLRRVRRGKKERRRWWKRREGTSSRQRPSPEGGDATMAYLNLIFEGVWGKSSRWDVWLLFFFFFFLSTWPNYCFAAILEDFYLSGEDLATLVLCRTSRASLLLLNCQERETWKPWILAALSKVSSSWRKVTSFTRKRKKNIDNKEADFGAVKKKLF